MNYKGREGVFTIENSMMKKLNICIQRKHSVFLVKPHFNFRTRMAAAVQKMKKFMEEMSEANRRLEQVLRQA